MPRPARRLATRSAAIKRRGQISVVAKTTSAPLSKSTRWRSYALLLLNTVTWAGALVIVKPALHHVTPFELLWYRYTIAILFSLPLLWHYRAYFRHWQSLLANVVGAELVGTTLALSLLYHGLARTSAIEASLLVSTNPVFICLAGIWLLKEVQTRREWWGLGLAGVGTVLLASFPLWSGQAALSGISFGGNLLILGQNLATALYFVMAKRWYGSWPKLLVITLSFYVGWVTFGLLSWAAVDFQAPQLLNHFQADLNQPSVWIGAGYLAIFASLIGLTAYIKGQEGIEASEAGLFMYLQPLVYLPLGVFWLGEGIVWTQILALALIAVGVWLAESRSPAK